MQKEVFSGTLTAAVAAGELFLGCTDGVPGKCRLKTKVCKSSKQLGAQRLARGLSLLCDGQ